MVAAVPLVLSTSARVDAHVKILQTGSSLLALSAWEPLDIVKWHEESCRCGCDGTGAALSEGA